MASEAERVKAYQDTIARLEPEIWHIDASAYYASAAISLKRIADALEQNTPEKIQDAIETGIRNGANAANEIFYQTMRNIRG